MGSEKNDPSKSLEWKAFEEPVNNGSGEVVAKTSGGSGEVVAKKRVRRKLREIPEHYFLPRRSLLSSILINGACIAGGIGAGMLIEIWIKKKVEEDGGIIWDFDKKSGDK